MPSEPTPHSTVLPSQAMPRSIAFYLPQFHPIPENDEWWGKGFTEWRNVTRAEPLFEGHDQPRRPADLGYYDLRVPEIMEQQAALAREAGIHGFCYYYYWFAGRRLLEKPLDRMLASGTPDFPFCLCWANENWSRRWDGSEQEVLMRQEYGEDYARRIIRDMLPFLQDARYIRVDGKPLLLVYRVDIIPDCAAMTDIWREEAVAAGLPGLYLVRVESFVELDPQAYGFDAATEFPPHLLDKVALSDPKTILKQHPKFSGFVFDYEKIAQHYGNKPAPDYKRFKALVPSWDNTARKRFNPYVLRRASPELYKSWLNQCLRETCRRFKGEERLLFINAWNEWAEGCYLEPDEKFGHRYLEATREAHAQMASELHSGTQRSSHDPLGFAVALFDDGQLEEAYSRFLSMVEAGERNPLVFVYLGLIALSSALPDDAHTFFQHAIDSSADRANTMAAIAQRCLERDQLAFAETYFSAAVEAQPTLIGGFVLLAEVWERQGRLRDALQLLGSFTQAESSMRPAILARIIKLARALGDTSSEYAASLLARDFPDSHARAIELMLSRDTTRAADLRAEAQRFAQSHGNQLQQMPAQPVARLRVGFVLGLPDASSTTLRLEALLRELDPQRFETFVFARGLSSSESTQRLFLLADAWDNLCGLDADACDARIRAHAINILINLDAYASLAALDVFSRRNAPLQVNWSWPPRPLALPCIDHLLVDALSASTDNYAELCCEAPAVIEHLPAFALPALDLPSSSASPLRHTAPRGLRLACLEAAELIDQRSWQAWARILAALPEARLRLNFSDLSATAIASLLSQLASLGIEAARIDHCMAMDSGALLEAWQDVDLGLCPLSGDSSLPTLLGLQQGVGSISSTAVTPWTALSAGLIDQLGGAALIAHQADDEDYVALAVQLASDVTLARELGSALRDRLQDSALLDTAGFAEAFAACLHALWQQKLEGIA
ncbi:glycoside hydrolase family 99-like domain-containing protein [Uliginosibacterium sediminicola]|uniref:Glycoside hydrolase family 99-like domain-containing protein n=1 Tax=Uliginosibacterium sediminicola TaxID=2024550 RepID=A0ABU9YVD5_9RHOO